MPADNLLTATNSMRSSVAALKRKLTNLKIQVELFDAELDKIGNKFDNVLIQAEVYKSRIEREAKRELRKLEKDYEGALKQGPISVTPGVTQIDLNVATSVGIIETLLHHMCGTSDDFLTASHAILFPAVYERIMDGIDERYYLPTVPASAPSIVNRGKEHIQWLRDEYETHLTDPQTWSDAIEYIAEWWRNDALPLLFGSRDERWDNDPILPLEDMNLWNQSATERALHFPKIFDCYEIYRRFKDEVYENSGLQAFEMAYLAGT